MNDSGGKEMNILHKKYSVILLSLMLTLGLTACSDESEAGATTTLTISAAASLTDGLQEAADVFNEKHPEIKVAFNFGGSGALQQQITQGAPADMFFSASTSDFDAIVDSGNITEEHATELLKNELVLVTPQDDNTVTSLDNITDAEQIAVGTPESVPAGEYAREVFDSLDITEEVEPLLVYAEDVRAVLTYVERGEVNAGLVYRTDALTNDSVEIVDTASSDTHDPIVYPVGLINDSDNAEAARTFYDFLQTEDALVIFDKYGFVIE